MCERYNEILPGIFEVTQQQADTREITEIHIFIIPGKPGKRSLMIDAGFRDQKNKHLMPQVLSSLGIRYEDLDVFLTHKHHDHTGLANFYAQRGARIFMNPEEDRHPYDCIYYNFNDKALKEQGRVLRTVGVSKEMTPMLWDRFMALNEHIHRPDGNWFFQEKKAYEYLPVTEGDHFDYGDYHFQAILLRGHTFGQMGLYDAEHKLVFSSDHVIDGIVSIVGTAYIDEHLLKYYFQYLKMFKDTYKGCMVYPAHNRPLHDADRVAEKIAAAYLEKLGLIEHIIKSGPQKRTIKEVAFLAYGIDHIPEDDPGVVKVKMIITKTFSCLEYLYDEDFIAREEVDGVLRYFRWQ